MLDFPEPPKRSSLRYHVHGVVVSIVLHGCLIVWLCVVSYIPWWYDAWAAREARAIRVTYSTETERPQEAEDDSPPVRIVSDPADVTRQMLKERLDKVIEESETSGDEDNLKELDRLTDRLTNVSSEASIDAMATAFGALMGTDKRAERPAEEPVEGTFDYNTAQFHDIKRYPREGGGWRYVAVLLDSQGRTIEVEMNEQEAEAAYLAMERIKRSPLLNKVYRQMAMPLFDQMLAGMRKAGDATEHLERTAEEMEPADGKADGTDAMEDPIEDSTAVDEVPLDAGGLP